MAHPQVRVDACASEADGADLWPVYESVFGDFSSFEAWRDAVWEKHRARQGFRLARAFEGAALVGFGYGYTGQPGQWWTDNARRVLEPDIADAWLGGHFELVSLAVVPDARRAGVGRRLMHALTEGLQQERLLLMTTSDPADPARCLYASDGWRVIGPGIGEATVIMGKRVPDQLRSR